MKTPITTDDAWNHLANTYWVPRETLEAQIGRIRGEDGTLASDFALADWLREQAQARERGMGAYGHSVDIATLSQVALFRLCAERLERTAKKDNPDWDKPIACA